MYIYVYTYIYMYIHVKEAKHPEKKRTVATMSLSATGSMNAPNADDSLHRLYKGTH